VAHHDRRQGPRQVHGALTAQQTWVDRAWEQSGAAQEWFARGALCFWCRCSTIDSTMRQLGCPAEDQPTLHKQLGRQGAASSAPLGPPCCRHSPPPLLTTPPAASPQNALLSPHRPSELAWLCDHDPAGRLPLRHRRPQVCRAAEAAVIARPTSISDSSSVSTKLAVPLCSTQHQ